MYKIVWKSNKNSAIRFKGNRSELFPTADEAKTVKQELIDDGFIVVCVENLNAEKNESPDIILHPDIDPSYLYQE